jgi:hypothetical protein
MRNDRPINMENTLLRNKNQNSIKCIRHYGEGTIEAADERLKVELEARRNCQASHHPNIETQVQGELAHVDEKLIKATAHREALEAELELARKAETATERKKAMMISRLKNVCKLKEENK